MILYVFTNHREKVSREEIVVVEKNTYYETVERATKRRYKKSDLDVVFDDGKFITQFSLCGRVDKFVNNVVEYKKKRVDELQKKMVAEQNSIIRVQQGFRYAFETNMDKNVYTTNGFLHCSLNGDKVHCKVVSKHSIEHEIAVLKSGEEFASELENCNIKAQIKNIFVDGKNTNLSIQDMEHSIDCDVCCITIEKFKELCNRAKVDVNLLYL